MTNQLSGTVSVDNSGFLTWTIAQGSAFTTQTCVTVVAPAGNTGPQGSSGQQLGTPYSTTFQTQ
jgi:hypothetical protein